MVRTVASLVATLTVWLGGCTAAVPTIESTTELANTSDTGGPYHVISVVRGVEGQNVELRYQPDAQSVYFPLAMERQDGSETYVGLIPGQSAGTEVRYYIAVLDSGKRVAADPEGASATPYTFVVQ